MKRLMLALAALLTAAPGLVLAQSAPNWSYGYTPTAGEVRNAFATKQDRLNFSPLSQAGGTMTGKLQTTPATMNGAGFSILPGVAPTSATNGDMWITSSGLFARIGGQAVQFLTSSSLGTMASQNANAVAITGGTINGAAIGGTTPAAVAATTISATTPIPITSGGTGGNSAGTARSGIGAAASGANTDITSLGSVTLGNGTTATTPAANDNSTKAATTAYADRAATNAVAGAVAPAGMPQGRLTLTSGTPVLNSAVSAATSVIYTPYAGNLVPLWNGAAFVMTAFSETTQALSDTTKSPSAAAAGQVYDLFAWSDSGTIRVTRGPAWSAGTSGSNTARGTGAGSTALTRVNGILVNAVAITNGPAAGYGTYVGTIATDAGGATVTFNTGTAAAGGGTARIGLWNAYNRVLVAGSVRDSNTSWSIGTTPAYADAGSVAFRVTFVTGLAEDPWTGRYAAIISASATQFSSAWVGLDSTTLGGTTAYAYPNSPTVASTAERIETPLGQHFFAPVEYSNGGTATAYGTSGTAQIQSGLNWQGRY